LESTEYGSVDLRKKKNRICSENKRIEPIIGRNTKEYEPIESIRI
jgi:hypothetical protein